MLKEFKQFISRGNALELAIAVVFGAAFGRVIDSLVRDVIMPPIGLLVGGVDFSDLFLVLRAGKVSGPYATLADAQTAGAVTVNYGVFVNTLVSFLLVAFGLFLVVKALNRLRRPQPGAPVPEDTMLLREIRDELRTGRGVVPTTDERRVPPPAH